MPSQTRGIYSVAGRATTVGVAVGTQASRTTTCCCPVCTGLQCLDRTRFFAGQLLSEADLNNEQSYWLAKSRLHNRYLNGWGVVCGMQVTCGECAGWVTVHSGYAIDPCGNDIIVCQDQNFNVLQAIQQCCAPATTQQANCSPLRYNPSPTCQDTQQEWCITIQYQEQASRLVTPLTSSTTQSSCACSCGSGGSGSSSSKSKTSSANLMTSGSCKSATQTTSSTTATVPAGACEATRIVEGFQLGIVPQAEVAAAIEAGNPNSLKSQFALCTTDFGLLLEQAPTFTNNTNAQSAYQSTCNYLAQVRRELSGSANITLCAILDDLSAIKVPAGQDIGTYTGIVAEITKLLAEAFLNCVCYTIIPPCPPQPCDNRIVLACVTVQNGEIVNICHYPGRKQLITLQTLGYWLGALGLDNLGTVLANLFSCFCCNLDTECARTQGFTNNKLYYNEALNTAGITSGADMNRIAAHYIAQTLGASMVNAIAPQSRAVDLRALVNMPTETAQAALERQGFKTVTVQSVDDDPAWTANAVSMSAQFAPAAVSAGQPLTLYSKGNLAVGFDVVDPTTAKLNDLQNQITALQNQLAGAQAAATASKGQAAPPSKRTPPK
jgi:hypothetical protein